MIHVDRAGMPVPDVLKSPAADRARAEAEAFSRQPGQERFSFKASLWNRARPALAHLFRNKCAYCESYLRKGRQRVVDHFRPMLLYGWLAYDWENLYPACPVCDSLKAATFPVGGRRARVPARGAELEAERALLLDPCLDDPWRYLKFLDDGQVESIPASGKHDRGAISIEVFGLNRQELVRARQRTAIDVLLQWDQVLEGLCEPQERYEKLERNYRRLEQQLLDTLRGSLEYTAVARDVLGRRLRSLKGDARLKRENVQTFLRQIQPFLRDPSAADPRSATVGENLREKLKPQLGPRPAYIQRIRIKNFRCLEDFSIKIDPRLGDEPAGWKVFLGENGTGKTSILEAVALALMGQTYVDDLKLAWDRILTQGKRIGRIQLELQSASTPEIELSFDKSGFEFLRGGEGPGTILRGYGHVRLLGARRRVPKEYQRVENLLKKKPLCDAESWLKSLKGRAFATAAATILSVLPEDTPDLDENTDEGVRIQLKGRHLSLGQLSDGYRSIIALTADIMSGIPLKSLPDLREVPGIVLLDEVGSQLHPSWRMRVVQDLRKAFPHMQFLATTHEPLCLRGLKRGEVVVLSDEEPGVMVFDPTEGPDPALLRVDQLLTSHYFGLNSTIDPDLDKEFQRYYELLARDEPDEEEVKELEELKRRLVPHRTLGHTRRDQLVYELIDEFLAEEKKQSPTKRRKLWERTKKRVKEIWTQVGDWPEVGS